MKIKSIRKAVLLLALLTSTSFAAGKNVNVEFRKGHSSAQYSGEIKGYDLITIHIPSMPKKVRKCM